VKIFKQISLIMADVPAIGKDSMNKQQGFKYRGIDAIYNALQPVFAKHGVFSCPEVLTESYERIESKAGGWLNFARLKIKYSFYADDGSSVSLVVVGEGMDSGDKASNKAMSVAHKYAITQLMKLPFASDDPDEESHTIGSNASKSHEYRIPFGKYKGQTIAEAGLDECFNYASWLHKSLAEKGEKPKPDAEEFFAQVKKARGA
jgi:hypothetical protein